MANSLTIQTESDRWSEGTAWFFVARDEDGDIVVRIDDEDWMHLRSTSPSWLEQDERDTAALAELTRIASTNPAVPTADGSRRVDVMLR